MATPSYHPFLFRIFHCKSSIWSTVKPLFKNLLQWELQGLDCWIQPFLSANWNKNPRVPWNSSHWFLFPFNRYQYTKHWLLIYESKKQARKKQATIASATGARTVTRLASLNTTASFANLIPRHNELSIPGMVESVAFALVGMHAPGKTFRDLTSFFSSPASFATYHAKMNFQSLAWFFFALRCLQSCLWRNYLHIILNWEITKNLQTLTIWTPEELTR